MTKTPCNVREITADAAELAAIHRLICGAFTYMDGLIDPPSSIKRFDLSVLRQHAAQRQLFAIGQPPLAAMIMRPVGEMLYLGKIAVAEEMRGQGLARQLIMFAAAMAQDCDLKALTLQSRVELTDNHRAFRALGFVETGRTSHPGFEKPTSITFTKPV